jgi:hypothetical protein
MDLDPDSVLPFTQLERPRPTRQTEMPVTASGAPGKLAFAPDDEASSPTLFERQLSGEVQVEFKHVSSGSCAALAADPYLTGKSRSMTSCRR